MATYSETLLLNANIDDNGNLPLFEGDPVNTVDIAEQTGSHTITFLFTNFVGRVLVEGSLSVDINTTQWQTVTMFSGYKHTVDTTGKFKDAEVLSIHCVEPTSGKQVLKFSGSFALMRARIEDWTSGTVNNIFVSH